MSVCHICIHRFYRPPPPCTGSRKGASVSDLGAAILAAKSGGGQSVLVSILGGTVHEFGLGLGAALLFNHLRFGDPPFLRTGPTREIVVAWLLLIGSAAGCFAVLAARRGKLDRWLGGGLVATYGVYVVYYFVIAW